MEYDDTRQKISVEVRSQKATRKEQIMEIKCLLLHKAGAVDINAQGLVSLLKGHARVPVVFIKPLFIKTVCNRVMYWC